MISPKRAFTDQQKEEVMARLLAAWKKYPDLRFGQFLIMVIGAPSIFYTEDFDLAQEAEELRFKVFK